MKAHALRHQPVFEQARPGIEAIEQRGPIERDRRSAVFLMSNIKGDLEIPDIIADYVMIEMQTIALDDGFCPGRAIQEPTRDEERLSKAMARLLRRPVGPKQGGQTVTRHRSGPGQRKVCQERDRRTSERTQFSAGRVNRAERSEELQVNAGARAVRRLPDHRSRIPRFVALNRDAVRRRKAIG